MLPVAALVAVLAAAGVYTVNSLTQEAPTGVAAAPTTAAGPAAPNAADLEAQNWLLTHVNDTEVVVVDALVDKGLVDEGWNLVTLLDADMPSLQWRDADYVVLTSAVRSAAESSPQLQSAIDNSIVVASFGDEPQPVQVRRVVLEGATLAAAALQGAADTRVEFGSEVAANGAIIASDADRSLLTSGVVDERISVVLGALAAEGDITVAGFPAVEGEQLDALRQVSLTELAGVPLVQDGSLTADAAALLDGFRGDFAPENVSVDAETNAVILRYPLFTDTLFD